MFPAMSTVDWNGPFSSSAPPVARARRLGLHTQREPIVIMRTGSAVCRAEGLAPRSQVLLRHNGREVTATLFQWDVNWLTMDEVGLSEAAWSVLAPDEGETVFITHAPDLPSLSLVRQRLFGHRLDEGALTAIVADVVAGRFSDVHLSAFLTATSALPLSEEETVALTAAMVNTGERLEWPNGPIADKHSVGGLPGNRTSPIVVAIAAACGLTIPKTSSRAVTSPAGTADAMATVTRVDLDLPTMRRVVGQEGGCLAWGGAVRLAPADDIFIGVERQLDIDTEGQLIASVLSKKIAAGANHVVLDIPVGPTAKVRSAEAAELLSERLTQTGQRFGLKVKCLVTDGRQPVGHSIGPALEMLDVLSVLRAEPGAPQDLRERALGLAGSLLELAGKAAEGGGNALARNALETGQAVEKFERICRAQGGFHEPPVAPLRQPIVAGHTGEVTAIDNRKLARLAKLAGAPDMPSAGLRLHVRVGDRIMAGRPLITLHAESEGACRYALNHSLRHGHGILLDDEH